MSESRSQDVRERLARFVDEIGDDQLREFVREAFTHEKTKQIYADIRCPDCDRRWRQEVSVPVPDYKERAKAVEMILNQGKGKPAEQKTVTVSVTARTIRDLESASSEELAAIVAGEAVLPELPAGD